MDGKLQHQIAFYLTGRRSGDSVQPLDGRLRPALFARHGDLTSLRYDFPLILNRKGSPGQALASLSRLVDAAVEGLAGSPDRDRIARHGYRIECEVRRELTTNGGGDFAVLWQSAASRIAHSGDELLLDSAQRLWAAFQCSGHLVDVDAALPACVASHMWNAIRSVKAAAFRCRAERLLLKLHDILNAEIVGSTAGRAPERLKASVGSAFSSSFDFDAMSRILVAAKPSAELSPGRRERIQKLIDVLERQRFYPLDNNGRKYYEFSFCRCSEALKAYQERHAEAVELIKTLMIAELEASGDYRESVHNELFEGFGTNGLDFRQLAELPDYLVCTNIHTLDTDEADQMVKLLAAGLPIKVLVQTDDVLEPSAVADGHAAFGQRARQLVNTAIGLTDVYVVQVSASHLYRMRESLLSGLAYEGPTLLSVFSGANGHTGFFPPYLIAAAALESRVFPALVYDPSAGSDWASRLRIDDNPRVEDDWPTHTLAFEDEQLQFHAEPTEFTLADFMALDDRYSRHFAVVPRAEWSDALISVSDTLKTESNGLPRQVPSIAMVDSENQLQRAILDERTLQEVRRCGKLWHSLQELGGIHNSHAERLLANERNAQASTMQSSPKMLAPAATPPPPIAPLAEAKSAPDSILATEVTHGDDPYIETGRCTTCNECIQRNGKMFAYNANKQAYIADPNAGTFRQLVEAAEGCQVSIIHPGKPRNPKEPGLEELIRRAAEFK